MVDRVAGRAGVSGLLLAVVLTACGTPAATSEAPLPVGSAPQTGTEAVPAPDHAGISADADGSADAATSADIGGDALRATPASVVLAGSQPAPVALANIAKDGSLNVPEDVDELGWWVGSKPMGSTVGTTLIAGHVDSAVAGLGYFATLTELKAGDPITVVDGVGEKWRFAVSETQQIGKGSLPQELFDTTGERKLALVTCGGEFDRATGHYTDNYIVWATPV